ncbi:TPA: hypothetical protein DCZ15_00110 [Candidatus Falkowbacteria bacterium]|nr:hypothetical protein [Candidatus Falkowbacteria bacterium]
MKNKISKIFWLSVLILAPVLAVNAANTKASDSIYVAKEEIVSGNLYAVGQTIIIDGSISGDLIAAAQTITVNGRVEGDVIAAAQDITINGEVGGNIRIAGNSLIINGSTVRNVNAFGNNIVLGADSRVGWDVYLAGARAELRGIVDGGFSGHVGQSLITGKIGKNVNLKLTRGQVNQNLAVTAEAIINGDLIYTSKESAQISDKADIGGKIEQKENKQTETNRFISWLWSKLFAIFSALTVGLFLIFVCKKSTPKILSKIEMAPVKMLAPGLIIMFILPPAAIVLAFTLIGIPLAAIVGFGWIAAVYLAKIITAILVGQLLIKKVFQKDVSSLLWPLVLGVVLCWLFFAIPFVGWIFGLIAVWLGLGGIWFQLSERSKNPETL